MTGLVAPDVKAAPTKSPDVLAAIFYADWCSYCKKMEPAAMATMKAYKGNTKASSTKVAAQNGISLF